MPRITEERRAANRAAIVDAARRCFARDGFHQTSMPDLVAEAGISAGAFYRYFSGKEDVVREIAHEAFGGLGAALLPVLGRDPAPTVAEIVVAVVDTRSAPTMTIAGREVDLDEQFRLAVQAWGEVLRLPELKAEAERSAAMIAGRIAESLARGQVQGRVPAAVVPDDAARFVVALLPGLIMQRTVLGLDTLAVGRAAEGMLGAPDPPAA